MGEQSGCEMKTKGNILINALREIGGWLIAACYGEKSQK